MNSLVIQSLSDLMNFLTLTRVVEIFASLLSCWGANRVANYGHSYQAIFGWAAWLLAGVLWVVFAAANNFWFMLITQGYFFYTAWVGFCNTRRNRLALSYIGVDSQPIFKGAQRG